eukprot:1156951-Pelagomonas_calceolata.AAC.13
MPVKFGGPGVDMCLPRAWSNLGAVKAQVSLNPPADSDTSTSSLSDMQTSFLIKLLLQGSTLGE